MTHHYSVSEICTRCMKSKAAVLLGKLACVPVIARHSTLPTGKERSPKWPACEHAHLKREPACRGCGSRHDLNVHHIYPFHEHPELELVDTNLVTLCRSCHFVMGHLNDWSDSDVDVIAVVVAHYAKVMRRKTRGTAAQPRDDSDSGLARPPDEHGADGGHRSGVGH